MEMHLGNDFMLSSYEKKISELILMGWSNRGIAKKIGVKEKTVKWHMHNIFKKSNTKTRAEYIATHYCSILGMKMIKEEIELPVVDTNSLPQGIANEF